MKILAVVSEIYPLVKTGGLADVAGALPAALAREGVNTITLVPGYPVVTKSLHDAKTVLTIADLFGGSARVLITHSAGLDLLVLDAPHLFARPGTPYADPGGAEWPDNAFRFAALGQAAARIGLGDVPAFIPDIIHCHDWQAGLTGAYLAYSGRRSPATVMTIHNIAFQGFYPADLLGPLGLPAHAFDIHGVEFYGGIGFLKAGLYFADRITTVSPTYAKEIQAAPGGCGLEGLLRTREHVVTGILNGIDTEVWNPKTDVHLVSHFDRASRRGRKPNKRAVQQYFGLREDPDVLLFGVVSRLAWQKGIDLVADAVDVLQDLDTQLVVLGAGDHALEQRLVALAAAHRGRIGCAIGYDEPNAHLIQGGADALLVPSRFEPCGLTQLCALRYGTVPVVAKIGGLADTVMDPGEALVHAKWATGFQFEPSNAAALADALRRVSAAWQNQTAWRRLQSNGMAVDVSWSVSAARYATLYRDLLATRK